MGEKCAVDRHIPLTGMANLRDLGGLIGLGGRRIKRGRYFRSSELFGLTDEDARIFRGLDLTTIYDLRSSLERERRPGEAFKFGTAKIYGRDYKDSAAGFPEVMSAPVIKSSLTAEAMLKLYRTIPYEHADSVRDIFQLLKDDRTPLLFHCVAGKDRTGIVAALFLDILGCSRDDIYDDYIMTNAHIDLIRTRYLEHTPPEVPAEIWEPVVQSDRRYLEAMFAHLDDQHGGAEGYLSQLGIGAADIESIRRAALESCEDLSIGRS